MSYIIVKTPSMYPNQRWRQEDSADGVLYGNFTDALKECTKIGASGVVEYVWSDFNEKISNNKKNNGNTSD